MCRDGTAKKGKGEERKGGRGKVRGKEWKKSQYGKKVCGRRVVVRGGKGRKRDEEKKGWKEGGHEQGKKKELVWVNYDKIFRLICKGAGATQ